MILFSFAPLPFAINWPRRTRGNFSAISFDFNEAGIECRLRVVRVVKVSLRYQKWLLGAGLDFNRNRYHPTLRLQRQRVENTCAGNTGKTDQLNRESRVDPCKVTNRAVHKISS